MKLASKALFAAVAAVVAVSGQSSSAKELIFAPWPPAVGYVNRVVMPKMFKEIDKETKGAIKWKMIAGGQLVGAKDSFTAPGDGLAAASFGVAIYQPNLVPALNTIYSTLVFQGNSVSATPAAMETFYQDCPQCIAEFKKLKLVGVGGWTTDQYHLACREPVTKVEDLKGLRIRGKGGPGQLWELAGATPIASTLPESVTLLQRGGLDCMHTVFSWLQTFGYGDFAKYVTDYPLSLSGPAIGMMINRDIWNGFTVAQRKLHLKEAAYMSAASATETFGTEEQKYLKQVEKEKGVKLVHAEKAGFDALIKKYEKVQRETVIHGAEGFGVKNPGKIIDAYEKNLAKWQKLTKDVGFDTNKLQKLMWDHIFSKIDLNKL